MREKRCWGKRGKIQGMLRTNKARESRCWDGAQQKRTQYAGKDVEEWDEGGRGGRKRGREGAEERGRGEEGVGGIDVVGGKST